MRIFPGIDGIDVPWQTTNGNKRKEARGKKKRGKKGGKKWRKRKKRMERKRTK